MTTDMITANGIQQRYEITGRDGAPWVTLVHGSADNHRAWWLQTPALAESFRVLTYDVRGHGETETPKAESPTQMTLVNDLIGLLDGLGIDRTALIGYSMGGGIVRNTAALHPDRVWGLVISNGGRLDAPPPANEEEAAALRARQQERLTNIRNGGMDYVFDDWLTQVYTPEFAIARPDIVAAHRSITVSNDLENYLHLMSTLSGPTGIGVDTIQAPSLIIVGAGDQYTGPEAANDLAAAMTGTQASVQVFPTRHGTPFERPEDYNRALLSFLNEHAPGV